MVNIKSDIAIKREIMLHLRAVDVLYTNVCGLLVVNRSPIVVNSGWVVATFFLFNGTIVTYKTEYLGAAKWWLKFNDMRSRITVGFCKSKLPAYEARKQKLNFELPSEYSRS